MAPKRKEWRSRDTRKAIDRVKRIKRELEDWPMSEARRHEKMREIHAIRITFNL